MSNDWKAENDVKLLVDELQALCDAVSNFHTSITSMESDLVVPDMLVAMYEELDRARVLLGQLSPDEINK